MRIRALPSHQSWRIDMARINTNVSALTAQRGLAKSQRQLSDTLQRLSSGLKINRGADDPAGLIASEGLRSEIAGLGQAIDNSSRASNVISTAESNLGEIANLLTNVKQLVVEAANSGALSQDEIAANQLQIDSAVASITRISNTATFAGLKLLNGSLDYITSGVTASQITALHVHQANFGTTATMPVQIDVLTSANHADLQFQASSIASSVTLEISGNEGVDVLTFTSGTAASAIAYAINRITDSTGVQVDLINSAAPTSGIVFKSSGYGSKSFVSVRVQSGTFATVNSANAAATRAAGIDAVATINGALTVADGLNLKMNTTTLDLEMSLDANFGTGNSNFTITGGGAKFQLGPQVTSNQQVSLGIQSAAASKLGDSDVGFLSDIVTGGNASLANGGARTPHKKIQRATPPGGVPPAPPAAFSRTTHQATTKK